MASLYAQAAPIELSELDRWTIGVGIAFKSLLSPSLMSYRRNVSKANALETSVAAMSDKAIRTSLSSRSTGLVDISRTLALLREAGKRTLGLRAHDVQLLAVQVLRDGKLAEMQTGEGKSLVAALTATLVASGGTPVHVITVNDYLAQRDAEKMESLYAFFGLTVGCVISNVTPNDRAEQYRSDITYCTNKDVAFDYLRDGVAASGIDSQGLLAARNLYARKSSPQLTLRGLHFAIVDEADSVLIDEARTPLILSGQKGDPNGTTLYQDALNFARQLHPNQGFITDVSQSRFVLLDAGRQMLNQYSKSKEGIWNIQVGGEFLVEQALKALHGLKLNRDYVIQNGKICIVDESTGRILEDRTWERGLHQLVEEKEAVEISGESNTIARITFQRFFSRYCVLSGMTGTIREAKNEMAQVYGKTVVRIPTNKTNLRVIEPAYMAQNSVEKWQLVATEISEKIGNKRAVLVGTQTVVDSLQLSAVLAEHGIEHRVLNALQDKEEAKIIASAGISAGVTVATNMAGRGTDILLDSLARESGGLHVILTSFHESPRVDRQLFGRAARQGDAGSGRAIVSIDDALFVNHSPIWLRRLFGVPIFRFSSRFNLAILKFISQTKAEKYNRAVRQQTRKSDTSQRQNLAFAGKAE
jgi:preprotein translocase subunit SecA